MGSEEESGKDWSELEEEAARGELKIMYLICMENFFFAKLCCVGTAPNESCHKQLEETKFYVGNFSENGYSSQPNNFSDFVASLSAVKMPGVKFS